MMEPSCKYYTGGGRNLDLPAFTGPGQSKFTSYRPPAIRPAERATLQGWRGQHRSRIPAKEAGDGIEFRLAHLMATVVQ